MWSEADPVGLYSRLRPRKPTLTGEHMTTERSDIELPAGLRSQEAALVIAQMDDQLRLLREDVRDLTVEEIDREIRKVGR